MSSPRVARRSTRSIIPTQTAGIDVAPANIDLAMTEGELFTAFGREQMLRDALAGSSRIATTSSSSTARPTSGC